MAKRPSRSEADEAGARRAPKSRSRPRDTREPGPEAVAGREPDPAKIQDHPGRIREAPGDAVAARTNATPGPEPTEEDIRARAYQMYLERGGEPGMDFDDWLKAERELKARKGTW